MAFTNSVMKRSVWAFNLEVEFDSIRSLLPFYPIIAVDTEYPGVLFHSSPSCREPENYYTVVKANVDRMQLIQLGLTLSDGHGNLPSFGTSKQFFWEFNFRDFDERHHPHAPDSIAFLRRKGIDFEKNRRVGVSIVHFIELMMFSGMLCNNNIQWITFHSAYDFGYMLKALSQRFLLMQPFLPAKVSHFLQLLKYFFGERIYDMKHLVKVCPNLHGGLDRLCHSLNLDNALRQSHQAGFDSLVILHLFNKTKNVYFDNQNDSDITKYAGVIYGLEMA